LTHKNTYYFNRQSNRQRILYAHIMI